MNAEQPDTPPPLPDLQVPERYNYIAAFLTLRCNLHCSFCINRFDNADPRYRTIPGSRWIQGLNRLRSRPDLPVTIQGGEPSLHPDFLDILCGVRTDLHLDVLTNLQFDIHAFMRRVPPDRIRRDAPYASLRVSYHPEVMRLDDLRPKVLELLRHGYSVGIWAVEHPAHLEEVRRAQALCRDQGIDFRIKEFLGVHNGKLYGTYKYPEAVSGREQGRGVECRTTELIVGPTGAVFRCHSDMYQGRSPVGELCDPAFRIEDRYRPCHCFGACNPCDIKVKTNRHQQFGHTSVEIRPLAGDGTMP